jgi:antitoxin component YwqK of YwqJK toxin-antitoxin module
MSLTQVIMVGILAFAAPKSPVCDTALKPQPSDVSITEPIGNLDSDTLAEPKKIQMEERKSDGNLIRIRFYIGKRGKKVKHGLYEVYSMAFAPGTLIESGFYEHGKREGTWKGWNLSGKLISETEYRNNEFNGYLVSYRESGAVAEKTKMKDGEFDCSDGFSEGFYENGKRKFLYQVKDGLEIRNERYDTLGHPIGRAE